MSDKVILVTGSTDGIGKQTAMELADRGFTVLLHGRSAERGAAVLEEIQKRTGNEKCKYYLADFSSLMEVYRVADQITKDHPTIDILINNAGIGAGNLNDHQRKFSQDGYELRLAVNYLAPFLLTNLLLPNLKQSLSGRIINVSSVGQDPIDLSNIMLEQNYSPFHAYKRSKLALTAFTFLLAKKCADYPITVNCLHPGSLLHTKMIHESKMMPLGPVKTGVDSILHLALSQKLEKVTGEYFDKKTKARANYQAYDEKFQLDLWGISKKLTRSHEI
jgi:NAD(P)-dependent dehydrogenase (short-subunit alcohol dehydrogenase family)